MSINKPRTVDHIGIDVSVDYAKNQKRLENVNLIEESRWVPQKTEVSVTKPYIPSEIDPFFASTKPVQWALFSPPPGYEASARALFSYQMIPSLGTYEKQEAESDRLEAVDNPLDQESSKKQDPEEQKERKKLSNLLKCIEKFDRTLTLINARRNQYQRG